MLSMDQAECGCVSMVSDIMAELAGGGDGWGIGGAERDGDHCIHRCCSGEAGTW